MWLHGQEDPRISLRENVWWTAQTPPVTQKVLTLLIFEHFLAGKTKYIIQAIDRNFYRFTDITTRRDVSRTWTTEHSVRALKIFLVFSQHPKWFVTTVKRGNGKALLQDFFHLRLNGRRRHLLGWHWEILILDCFVTTLLRFGWGGWCRLWTETHCNVKR